MRLFIASIFTLLTGISKLVTVFASPSVFIVFWFAIFGIATWSLFWVLLIVLVSAGVGFILFYILASVALDN